MGRGSLDRSARSKRASGRNKEGSIEEEDTQETVYSTMKQSTVDECLETAAARGI